VQAQAAGDLAAASGLAAASVSEHLKVLRKTGLVVLERRGRFRLYRTEPSCVLAVVRSIEQLVSRAADGASVERLGESGSGFSADAERS
jgi:DNA-binding transcriptional ArsR family regulator